jgi:hypothetical protein
VSLMNQCRGRASVQRDTFFAFCCIRVLLVPLCQPLICRGVSKIESLHLLIASPVKQIGDLTHKQASQKQVFADFLSYSLLYDRYMQRAW